MTSHASWRLSLAAGITLLAIVMGIGRFAYTPLLPLMQADQPLSDLLAGWLASANYLGYLLGALWLACTRPGNNPLPRLRRQLLLNLACVAAMGLTSAPWLWLLWRLLAGWSSAAAFVLASGLVLEELGRRGQAAGSGWLYSGVGLGIALSALAVPWLDGLAGWRGGWLGLAALGGLLALLPWFGLPGTSAPVPAASMAGQPPVRRGLLRWLLLAYFCEGLGYIITGTFMVAMLHQQPALAGLGHLSWLLVGLAAIPSCGLWLWLGNRLGLLGTLIAAHLTQALGIVLPLLWPGPAGALLGALLFGGTFMGITALALSLGRRLAPSRVQATLAGLTAAFGLGQIIGPVLAGLSLSRQYNYDQALLGGGLVVLLGALALLWGRYRHPLSTTQGEPSCPTSISSSPGNRTPSPGSRRPN
ncbi:YbfB/YjiJ family MFS transporter [Zobellella endophytica]|uniref:YbfB/YjiJ family MFS transporter n=1 Tax=Zobellella endophytica TaxID=2116700 RepID=UPI001304BD35|nr:YbfB/YjiJ family MFS transporter [Zobellella endophytica]